VIEKREQVLDAILSDVSTRHQSRMTGENSEFGVPLNSLGIGIVENEQSRKATLPRNASPFTTGVLRRISEP
jgi:hypothetical protein